MLRSALRTLLLLAAFPGAALAAADLVPLPWTSAGFSAPPGDFTSSYDKSTIPLAAPITGVFDFAQCFRTGGGFGIPPGFQCTPLTPPETFTSTTGVLALDRPQFQFHATLVSSLSGSQWTVELVSPTLVFTPPAIPGESPTAGQVVQFRLFLDAFPSAVFSVPDVTPGAVESVAFASLPTAAPGKLELLQARSARIGSSSAPYAPGFVEPLVDGDTLTLVGRARYQVSFTAAVFIQTVAGTVWEVKDPCGTGSDATALPPRSCKVGLELSTVQPSGAVASLACRSDVTRDGVVNFADLAAMKSVFFQRCQP